MKFKVIITFTKEELALLRKLFGNMSTDDCYRIGIDDKLHNDMWEEFDSLMEKSNEM